MTAKGSSEREERCQTFSASSVQHFKISPKSILDIDPIKDGYESQSLSKYVKDNNKKGGNPVVCEGYGTRNMYPKRLNPDAVPDSNRVVPGMPNCIKSKGVDDGHVYVRDTLMVTDSDLKYNEANVTNQYTDAQQIVMNGRPITWSTSSTVQSGRSNLNSIAQSASGQDKYDPSAGYESSKERVNKLIDTVNDAVSNIKGPTEVRPFDRNQAETKNLAFSAVPFQPWAASKIMPLAEFDPRKPYVPMKVDLKHSSTSQSKSIIEDHAVLNNPIVNKRYKNFNRTARGFGAN